MKNAARPRPSKGYRWTTSEKGKRGAIEKIYPEQPKREIKVIPWNHWKCMRCRTEIDTGMINVAPKCCDEEMFPTQPKLGNVIFW